MRLRVIGVGTIAASLVVAPVHAGIEDVDLASIEDIESFALTELLELPVTAASRYAQKPGGSPMLVSAVDSELIERFGYRTVGDAVRGLRGIYTTNDRNYSYLGARGISLPGDYNTRFSLAIDDHRMNDPVYGQATPGAELGMPMIAVERIELLRGGAWSVHGESAMLGAIQIITASGATRPGLRVQTTGRAAVETYEDPANRPAVSSRGQDVSASYGALERGVDVFVAGSYSYDPGLASTYYPALGVVRGGDTEEVGSSYAVIKSRGFALRALAARRRKLVNTASFGSAFGPPIETFDDHYFVDLEYAHSSEHADVVAHVSGDHYQYAGTYPHAAEPAAAQPSGESVNLDKSEATWARAELRGRLKQARWGQHLRDLELGLGAVSGISRAHQENADLLDAAISDTYLDRKDSTRMVGMFGHASARAFDRVVGFAALRGDYHASSVGLVMNPQLGLVLDGGTQGRVRASMSRGYRAPNIFEQYYGAAVEQVEATPLTPERSSTHELSLERYLGPSIRMLVVGYRQDITDLITLTPGADGTILYSNVGGVVSYGVEGELEGRWDRVRLRTNYSRQRTRTLDGQRPANSPSSLAYMMVMAPIAGGRCEVGVEARYIGERTSFDGTSLAPVFSTNVVATIHRIAQGLELDLGISNLFDERGSDPSSEEHVQSSLPHDPRVVWARLRVELP